MTFLIKTLNPEDYLDDKAKELIKYIKIDLLPISTEGGFEGEYDCFILIEGKAGYGKSTLASLLSMAIDITYQKEIRTIYRSRHYWQYKTKLLKNINKDIDCARGKAVSFDELRNVLYSKKSLDREQMDIETDLGNIRKFGIFWTACIDDAKSILRYLRETRIDIWIYCRTRRRAKVYKLYSTEHSKNQWNLEKRIEFTKKMLLKGMHPYTPYSISWKPIPKNSLFWINFIRREIKYKANTKETKKITQKSELMERRQDYMDNTYGQTEVLKVLGIGHTLYQKWVKEGKATIIGKRYPFKYIETVRGRRFDTDMIRRIFRIMYPNAKEV